MKLQTGTKSILFGAHCFFLHPWFVAAAWWKLYGFPWDPRLWVCFFVHDLGYWGLKNMDDEVGEMHPVFGAKIAAWFFDYDAVFASLLARIIGRPLEKIFGRVPKGRNWNQGSWYTFCLYHSRFLAKRYETDFSPLCVADKLAIYLTPAWLYLPMVTWSGEIYEYMRLAKDKGEKYAIMNLSTKSKKDWHRSMINYLRKWVEEHQDLREDTWTPNRIPS